MSRFRFGQGPAGGPSAPGSGPLGRLRPVSPFQATAMLAAAFAGLVALYLLLDFLPVLLLAAAVTVAGVDRLLRLHPEARFHGATATALYLFVPALYVLGAGLLLNELAGTLWPVAGLAVAVLIYGLTVNAEYLTVDPNTETYEAARFILLAVIYVIAFAIFAVVFRIEAPLWAGMAMVGIAALLLTVDILRELEPETRALLTQAGAVALVMAETRLVVYYTALGDYLAGAFLLIVFYVMTGLVQNQVSGRLDRPTLVTYGAVALAGAIIVAGARVLAA